MALAILFFPFFYMLQSVSSNVILQNSGFESPPTNITSNATSEFLLLDNKVNTIPGWAFNGTVWYTTAGHNVSLPRNGHGLRLGPNGQINQTFRDDDNIDNNYEYVVTFTLASSGPGCGNNATVVNVSGPDSFDVFFFNESLGKEMWQTHALILGEKKDKMNLVIQSVSNVTNVTCWPVVDDFLITGIQAKTRFTNNGVYNSGFEVGPGFPENSSQGIILNENTVDSRSTTYDHSPLPTWDILGTVKYIDSKHYAVPQGRAAVELISGNPSGIINNRKNNQIFLEDKKYTLDFMMGDANDSCVGDFKVFVQVANMKWNFTMRSIGIGLSENHYVTFKAESNVPYSISFVSSDEIRNRDKVLCGPVIDSIDIQQLSNGIMLKLRKVVMIFNIVLVVAFLMYMS